MSIRNSIYNKAGLHGQVRGTAVLMMSIAMIAHLMVTQALTVLTYVMRVSAVSYTHLTLPTKA